jgi:hypothetical protein
VDAGSVSIPEIAAPAPLQQMLRMTEEQLAEYWIGQRVTNGIIVGQKRAATGVEIRKSTEMLGKIG